MQDADGSFRHVDLSIRPYEIHVAGSVLDDLRSRLRSTRWPDPAPGPAWGQGTDLDYLQDLVAYWAEDFDWRAQERRLNAYGHFVAQIDGVDVHFVHHRSGKPPLILTHGWPSSFVELLPLVDRLSEHFDLVVPSLPGYAFSSRLPQVGVDRRYVAGLWHRLLQGLGYERYGAHGGDFGAGVATFMALTEPARMTGIHLSTPEVFPYLGPGSATLSPVEQAYLDHVRVVGRDRARLQRDPVDPAPDPRLRPHRLPGGAGSLARREVAGLERQQRRRRRPHRTRCPAHDDHALLGDGLDHLVDA